MSPKRREWDHLLVQELPSHLSAAPVTGGVFWSRVQVWVNEPIPICTRRSAGAQLLQLNPLASAAEYHSLHYEERRDIDRCVT